MEGARVREAQAGRRPLMPRKALVPARAALRFAHEAAGECGLAQPAQRGMPAVTVMHPGRRRGHAVELRNVTFDSVTPVDNERQETYQWTYPQTCVNFLCTALS